MSEVLYPEKPILMVDDEEFWLVGLEALLARHGNINNVIPCTDSTKVMELLAEQEFSLVLLDYGMPGVSGEELLSRIVLLYPQLPVVILTGHDQVDMAVRCKDLGALNYLVKTEGEVPLALSILEILRKDVASNTIEKHYSHPELFTDIVAHSAKMQAACQALDAAVDNPQPLLLIGEPGAGKRFLAQRLIGPARHCELDAGQAGGVEFVKQAWVAELLGKYDGGFVYLHNLNLLDAENQLQLLKLLQEPLTVRFIFTLTDLEDLSIASLRDDLLRLLKVQRVEVPPLRQRKADLPGLTRQLIEQAAEACQKKPPTPPSELDLLLQSYSFPGNVSELKEMVFVAVKLHRARKMSMDSFKLAMESKAHVQQPQLQFSEVLPTIDEAINLLIDEAERRADGNQSIMANMLGITRQALNRRLNNRRKD
jgi:DNA-binding NtrC family response regulator